MTFFEYLSVAVSIVLSLSAAQLLTSMRVVFRRDQRYWVHALWFVHILIVHILVWWASWAYREVETWNLALFTLLLVNPGILFVCSNALVQRDEPTSWEQHFFAVRRSFFLMRGLITIVTNLRVWLFLGLPILDARGVLSLLVLIICAVGIFSEDKRVHGTLAVIGLAQVLGVGYLWSQPGVLTLDTSP